MVEGDGRAVRRPVEAADDEVAFRERARLSRRDVEEVEMRHAAVLILDSDLSETLIAFLDAFRDRVGHRERDARVVRRPGKAGDVLLRVRESLRLTTGDRDPVDLPFTVAIGN